MFNITNTETVNAAAATLFAVISTFMLLLVTTQPLVA